MKNPKRREPLIYSSEFRVAVMPAFPDGIPEEIAIGGNKHKKPFPAIME
jgi:hypothetical protein